MLLGICNVSMTHKNERMAVFLCGQVEVQNHGYLETNVNVTLTGSQVGVTFSITSKTQH